MCSKIIPFNIVHDADITTARSYEMRHIHLTPPLPPPPPPPPPSPFLVPHTCVSESGQLWFRQWLIVYSSPSYYLNQYSVFVNGTHRNKLKWNHNKNTKLFIHENASENIVFETEPFCPGGYKLIDKPTIAMATSRNPPHPRPFHHSTKTLHGIYQCELLSTQISRNVHMRH